MKFSSIALALAVSFLAVAAQAGGRGVPMVPFDNIALGTTSSQAAENAIRAGAARRGWRPEVLSAEVVRCHLDNRQHVVVVDVFHTANSISVKYVSSANMNYNAGTGTIHRKYNGWVKNLVSDIQAAAASSGAYAPPPPAAAPAVSTPAASAPAEAKDQKPSAEERLKKLGELRDKGLISTQEYDAQRKEILNSL